MTGPQYGDFELHVICPEDWVPPDAWLTLIHKPCGGKCLPDDWEMVDLEVLNFHAANHRCPNTGDRP